MRRYEMMIILDPSLEEQTVQPSLDQFLTVVKAGGGSVDKVDVWGRRRLAYEIQQQVRLAQSAVSSLREPASSPSADNPAQNPSSSPRRVME